MPKIDHLAKLFRAIGSRDLDEAGRLAAEIVSRETEIGHHTAAQLLKGALNGQAMSSRPTELAKSLSLANALVQIKDPVGLDEVMLRHPQRKELQTITLEWQNRDRLNEFGIRRRSKLLFHGPPGCGKSLAAGALGFTLGLPTYVIRFDAVVGAYLGQTAIHLRELFRYAEMTPCVLLFDEIDALGKKRGNPLDVGELDRIVIALMQELEHSTPAGLIIATSNLPDHLDSALWRRFDLAIKFPKPSKIELKRFVGKLAQAKGVRVSGTAMQKATLSQSYADALKVITAELRNRIINDIEGHNG